MHIMMEESDPKISVENYYAVVIKVDNIPNIEMKKLAKKFLSDDQYHLPLIVYNYEDTITILFPPSVKHFDGSYCAIISEYIQRTFRYTDTINHIECRIVEFKSKSNVMIYFTYIIHLNEQQSIKTIGNGNITDVDIGQKTNAELIAILADYGIEWGGLLNHEKYGTFYKLKYTKKKISIVSLSELLDAREIERYNDFIFE